MYAPCRSEPFESEHLSSSEAAHADYPDKVPFPSELSGPCSLSVREHGARFASNLIPHIDNRIKLLRFSFQSYLPRSTWAPA